MGTTVPHGEDLRGRSFHGARLDGADLHGSDLRGVDFGVASLRGADLRDVRTGTSARWTWVVVPLALLVSVACGLAAGYAGRTLHRALASDVTAVRVAGGFTAVALVLFLLAVSVRGLHLALRKVLPIESIFIVATAIVAIASGAGTGRAALLALAFLLVVAATLTLAIAARTIAGAAGSLMFVVVALTGALTGTVLGGGATATAIAIAALVAGKRALRGAEGYPLLERALAHIAVRGGTSFRGADLREASFEGAALVACDFRGSRLEGAHFDRAAIRLSLFDGSPPRPRSHGGSTPTCEVT